MPTQPYFNKAGKRLDSNTQVIAANLGWSKNGLMYWAWNEGREGRDYRQTRDSAADAGTLAHAMIEANIKGRMISVESFTPDRNTSFTLDQRKKATKAFDNYLEWKSQTRFEPITMETPVVSEILQAGTTIDVIGWVVGKRAIVEVKTSNGVYEDYLIQVAMQKFAWEETHPDEPIQGLHLLKIGKEDANFAHFYWENLDKGLEAFKHLRALHDLKKELKKLI